MTPLDLPVASAETIFEIVGPAAGAVALAITIGFRWWDRRLRVVVTADARASRVGQDGDDDYAVVTVRAANKGQTTETAVAIGIRDSNDGDEAILLVEQGSVDSRDHAAETLRQAITQGWPVREAMFSRLGHPLRGHEGLRRPWPLAPGSVAQAEIVLSDRDLLRAFGITDMMSRESNEQMPRVLTPFVKLASGRSCDGPSFTLHRHDRDVVARQVG
ncbi:MAG: hypothetical protein ITG02_10510 [Patulibacter sp.]|nr:hypothetical protein [Patulibacter sp.]